MWNNITVTMNVNVRQIIEAQFFDKKLSNLCNKIEFI